MTQNKQILDYMEKYGSITPLEALRDIGCMRLASRISDLRKMGCFIRAETIAVPNRYGKKTYIKRYSLEVQDGRCEMD